MIQMRQNDELTQADFPFKLAAVGLIKKGPTALLTMAETL